MNSARAVRTTARCRPSPSTVLTLVTSRKPGDLKAFDEAFLEVFARQAA
ncbi:hypothetical protein OG585_37085 [Streptomyces sp. NBC_01340]|nr:MULTISPECIES: hypothetical protein [unclassified Streptomyces]MCX4458148.1 hypothetical protein [Streptomyces sp. NBC_01719]MCX4497505.1 hypothetical protein [Streptomyces sp. NBC_01728]WSI42337.1 hypothetical protein OG585_37085 [Streptomyces sp. NBC_01340]